MSFTIDETYHVDDSAYHSQSGYEYRDKYIAIIMDKSGIRRTGEFLFSFHNYAVGEIIEVTLYNEQKEVVGETRSGTHFAFIQYVPDGFIIIHMRFPIFQRQSWRYEINLHIPKQLKSTPLPMKIVKMITI